jgi:hypothetical protein
VVAAAAAANRPDELPTLYRQFNAIEKLDAPAWDHCPAPVRFLFASAAAIVAFAQALIRTTASIPASRFLGVFVN